MILSHYARNYRLCYCVPINEYDKRTEHDKKHLKHKDQHLFKTALWHSEQNLKPSKSAQKSGSTEFHAMNLV